MDEPPLDPLLEKEGKGRYAALAILALVLLASLAQAAEPIFFEDFLRPLPAHGWSGTRLIVKPADGVVGLAAAPGPTGDAWLWNRLPLGPPSPATLPCLRLDLAGADAAVFAGLSIAAANRLLLRDADLPGFYNIDLTAALPSWVGQTGPLPVGLGLAGATVDRPGPVTRVRSLALLREPPAMAVVDSPEQGQAWCPDGVVRQGERVRLRLPATTPGTLTASVAGPPRRPVPVQVEQVGDGLASVTLPDGLMAGPGELLLSFSPEQGQPRHVPIPQSVDTRSARPASFLQPVGVSAVRPTLDGVVDDLAWRNATALAGLGTEARVLLLALNDGLAIAARVQRPDGQPPAASANPDAGDRLALALSPAGLAGPQHLLALSPRGDAGRNLAVRIAVPGQSLLGASDGGWIVEAIVPWAALGEVDAEAFGLRCEAVRPGCQPETVRWPGDGSTAWLAGLPDLAAYCLPTGPPNVSTTAAALVVEMLITNRTGHGFVGVARAALERPDGLSLAESEVRLGAGESGTVRWQFKPGQGTGTLLWRIESAAAPTLRRVGRAGL